MYRNSDDDVFGLVALQTDDTFILGNDNFAAIEQDELVKADFQAKERKELTTSSPLQFNGGIITLLDDGSITLTQVRQCENLSPVNIKRSVDLKSMRGEKRTAVTPKDQYIA